MNRPDIDWGFLRQEVLTAAVLLSIYAVLWGATSVFHSRALDKLAAEQQTLSGLEAERDDVTLRLDARRKYARLYTQLSAQGVVGAEQRLGWVQATRDAGTELGLPYLRYAASPQRAFEAPWLVPGVTAPVLVSLVDLQVGLVHELDLLRLLARLHEAPGVPEVQSCNLERLGADVAPEPDKANLTGSCQLALFTIPRESAVAAADPEK